MNTSKQITNLEDFQGANDGQTAPYCLFLRLESPCRQWQHNVALSASIPLQPAPFLGKFSLWRIEVAEKWDELFMTFGHNDGMKMGLGCCGRARMRS
jgi:hypothetical protein